MNILLTLNDDYSKYAVVMLESLFTNSVTSDISIFCLFDSLDENSMNMLNCVCKKHGVDQIEFIKVDKSIYDDFPTTDKLTVECYFILLAHLFLPNNMDRILYLDSDLIICKDLSTLYSTDFDGKSLIVCGNYYKEMNGRYARVGARPEKGGLFNSGVIIFNLNNMRNNVNADTYLVAARQNDYCFELADQGILNIVFKNDVKYISTLEYNFRLAIYKWYIEDGNDPIEELPAIIHYTYHDNYGIGIAIKPWELLFSPKEILFLKRTGRMQNAYVSQPVIKKNIQLMNEWWRYAKKTSNYSSIWSEMNVNKKRVLHEWYPTKECKRDVIKFIDERNAFLREVTNQKVLHSDKRFEKYNYGDINEYVDTLSTEEAKKVLISLQKYAFERMQTKKVIKIGFVVSSPSEWECETIYRRFERDERFEVTILACGNPHGNSETIEDTYKKTCTFFSEATNRYNIEYLGCTERQFNPGTTIDYDILFYAHPIVYVPYYVSINAAKLSTICVFLQYGIELVSREDVRYWGHYYDWIMYKLCWKYFCTGELVKEYIKKNQRLGAYNIDVSGFPKADILKSKNINAGNDLWKGESQIKIIWAPHFNMEKGQNGTFHENYRWFLEYAKIHPEVSFLIKPHPRLAIGAIDKGVFNSFSEYQEYLQEWMDLPNANVMEHGDYFDAFVSSDAMILDSISFLAQYQYVGKPLLFLMPEEPRCFNDLGKTLLDVIYKSKGNDFDSIERFIEEVKVGIDPLIDDRKIFYEKYLDNHMDISPTEYIYKTITEHIWRNEGVE